MDFMMLMFSSMIWTSDRVTWSVTPEVMIVSRVNGFISHSQGQWSVMKERFHEEWSCFQVYWNPAAVHFCLSLVRAKDDGQETHWALISCWIRCQRFQRVSIPAHPYTVTDTRALQQHFRAEQRALGPPSQPHFTGHVICEGELMLVL